MGSSPVDERPRAGRRPRLTAGTIVGAVADRARFGRYDLSRVNNGASRRTRSATASTICLCPAMNRMRTADAHAHASTLPARSRTRDQPHRHRPLASRGPGAFEGGPLDPQAASSAMLDYARAGFDTFDMADHYGSAEIIAGRFLQRAAAGEPAGANPPVAFTKWCPTPGPMTRDIVREGVEQARARLGVETIDLLQFHWWTFEHPGYLDAMKQLADLREEGLIRHIGVTNFDTAHLRVLVKHGIPIVSNQVSFSLLDRRAAGEMSEFCFAHGVRPAWLTEPLRAGSSPSVGSAGPSRLQAPSPIGASRNTSASSMRSAAGTTFQGICSAALAMIAPQSMAFRFPMSRRAGRSIIPRSPRSLSAPDWASAITARTM